jgi:hypothetical protein
MDAHCCQPTGFGSSRASRARGTLPLSRGPEWLIPFLSCLRCAPDYRKNNQRTNYWAGCEGVLEFSSTASRFLAHPRNISRESGAWRSDGAQPAKRLPIEEKVRVVLAVLGGEMSASEAARRHGGECAGGVELAEQVP